MSIYPTAAKGFEDFCTLIDTEHMSERSMLSLKTAFYAGVRSTLIDVEDMKTNFPAGITEQWMKDVHAELDQFFAEIGKPCEHHWIGKTHRPRCSKCGIDKPIEPPPEVEKEKSCEQGVSSAPPG